MTLKNPRTLLALSALFPLTLLSLVTTPAHAQELLWIRQFGTISDDSASALAPDGVGGVMVAGETYGSLGRPNGGWRDVFLTRYDSAGDQLWIRQFGAGGSNRAGALAPDGAGGVLFAGSTFGSVGGAHAGGVDAFLARYDSAGNRLWIRQLGTIGADWAYALAPDGAGGVMIAGFTSGSVGGPNAGGYDMFLARYGSAGQRLWIRPFGSGNTDTAIALARDGAGNVIVAGKTTGSLGGQHAGGFDVWLARYDGAGNQLWIRQFGSSVSESASALAPDGAGGVLFAGSTFGSVGGPNAGGWDAFLARYDSAGERLWIRQFGTRSNDYVGALVPDGAGGVMIAGFTSGSLGGPNAGDYDFFLARYDSAGDQVWTRQFGTSNRDQAWGLAPDGVGGVMVAGHTDGSLGGPNSGGSDAFLARFGEACYADCDGSGEVNTLDFLCFLNLFSASDPDADCNGDGSINTLDFLCFLNAFNKGCP